MKTVELGKDLNLDVVFRDSAEDLYDPAEVTFSIVKNATRVIYGPYLYTEGEVAKISTGMYRHIFTAPNFLTPGYFTAKWEAEIEGEPYFEYEDFAIVDPPVVSSEQLDAPRRYGIIRESHLYSDFGYGATDSVFLVGHAAGMNLNDPYQVVNIQEAINLVGADFDAPLFLALLEAYNSGARDIWLVAAAPMTEYVSNITDRFTARDEWGGLNFYERYKERLDATYSILEGYDIPEIIVPLEAPFYYTGGVDFLTQLVDHCEASFIATGAPRIGIIGTCIENWTANDVTTMATDPRLEQITDGGKFVMVVVGEGTNILPQGLTGYRSSAANCAAALLATQPLGRGLTYQKLPYTASFIGRSFTQDEINTMCRARLNPVIKSQRGKRGIPFECLIATDNTLTPEGSDYWSISTTRLVTKTMQDVRALGRRTIGTIGYVQFKYDVRKYFSSLVANNTIKGFQLNIEKDPVDGTRLFVDIELSAYLAVREIYFTVEVGIGG